MYAYMNQEAKKNNWTPNENDLMHFVHCGANYYNTYPSKANIPLPTKKDAIIEALQTLIANNSHIDDIETEMCLELVEGPLISQAIDYALKNSIPRMYLAQTPQKKAARHFCCFGKIAKE